MGGKTFSKHQRRKGKRTTQKATKPGRKQKSRPETGRTNPSGSPPAKQSLTAKSSKKQIERHKLLTVSKRCGPGLHKCPIKASCPLSAHKHYHYSCGAGGWRGIVKATKHVNSSPLSSVDWEQSIGAKLLARCSSRDRKAEETLEALSDAELPPMAMRSKYGKPAELDRRLDSLSLGKLCASDNPNIIERSKHM